MRSLRSEKLRLILALTLAAVAAADNISTLFAVERGAVETNPLVSLFLQDIALFILFTIVKIFLCFYVVYKTFSKSRTWLLIYSIVLAVFIRATVINTLNALGVG